MRRRRHPIALFIWIVAIVIFLRDLTAIPWGEIGTIAAGTGSESPLTFLGVFFLEIKNAFFTFATLIGLATIVDLLDKIRSRAS